MVNDYSNKSYAKKIAGILIMIAVVVMIVALILGVVGSKDFTDKYVRLSKTDASYTLVKEDSVKILNNQQGNDKLVSGSKSGCSDSFVDWDTCAGTIDIEVVQDPDFCVPVCIDANNLDSFLADLNNALNITAKVSGGYEPKDYMSDLVLSQFGLEVANIDIDWQQVIPDDDCCYDYWVAVFTGIDEMQPGPCGAPGAECVTFEASVPITEDDITPECMDLDCVCWPPDVKEISLELEILWEGCHFWTILASDLHFLESPTPEIIIAS